MNDSIIIIGAGAAGLMAARELSSQQKNIIILEANDRLGGRIWTISDNSFSQPVEAGAEFIHPNSDLTKQLLNEANISYNATKGRTLSVRNGEAKQQNDFTIDWDEIMHKMHELKKDITVADFLNRNFPGEQNKEV